MNKNDLRTNFLILTFLSFTLCLAAFSQASPSPADPKSIPEIDGAIGSCSADFTITDSASAPVYNAKINVHIAYGFGSFHKLDLEVSTNADGKARFTGLPNRLKRPLTFHASEGGREGEVIDDPEKTCKAQFTIALSK
jgi:hypothetical protein